jgi:hypothetical protein
VLDDLARDRLDGFVCLDDVYAGGPQPVECFDRVRSLGCPIVMGNTDWWLANYRYEPHLAARAAIGAWAIEQLGPERVAALAAFQPWVELDLGNERLLCVHGTRDGLSEYAIVSEAGVDLRRVRYDLEAFRRTIVASGMPHAEEAARRLA